MCFAATNWDAISYHPKEGFVPDQKTAIAIAEAVLRPIYGEETLAHERPFTAKLAGELWTVEGSIPPGMLGGVATAIIAKKDGRIMAVWHEK